MSKSDNTMTQDIDYWLNDIHTGHALNLLRDLPANSIHMIMFSPPYWGPRDYGEGTVSVWNADEDCEHQWDQLSPTTERNVPDSEYATDGDAPEGDICTSCGGWRGKFGLEPSYEMYVRHMVELGGEIRRVLRDDGSWWLNIGDVYSNKGGWQATESLGADGNNSVPTYQPNRRNDLEVPNKSRMLLPKRVAIELAENGWLVRNDAIWRKTNPMPESVTDRLSTTFEYLFHLVPNPDYYYDLDAIREPYKNTAKQRASRGRGDDNKYAGGVPGQTGNTIAEPSEEQGGLNPAGKNPGDVFETPTESYPEGHFAVYPEELCVKPIKATAPKRTCANCRTPYQREVEVTERPDLRDRNKERIDEINDTDWNNNRGSWAGTPKEHRTIGWQKQCDCPTDEIEPGIVLDPMYGRGTTLKVAADHGRHYIGFDINASYTDLAEQFVPDNRQSTLDSF